MKYPKPKWWKAILFPATYARELALHEGRLYWHIRFVHGQVIRRLDRESLHNSTGYKRQMAAARELAKHMKENNKK